MSGVGKSTLLAELERRGHFAVDTDYDGWELPGSVWDEPRMDALLAAHTDVVVSGTAENQARFYDRFEYVVLLSAPVDLLIQRIASRENNPYGRTAQQQADVRRYVVEVEPLFVEARPSSSTLVDLSRSLLMLWRLWTCRHR
jgi:hypothetical protein